MKKVRLENMYFWCPGALFLSNSTANSQMIEDQSKFLTLNDTAYFLQNTLWFTFSLKMDESSHSNIEKHFHLDSNFLWEFRTSSTEKTWVLYKINEKCYWKWTVFSYICQKIKCTKYVVRSKFTFWLPFKILHGLHQTFHSLLPNLSLPLQTDLWKAINMPHICPALFIC
jgi:hypothetical protein